MNIIGVPTSERTAALCRELGVPLSTLEETPELDLTIDGADEIDPALSLIKGGGGALLREKIVAAASRRMIVIADQSKLVDDARRFPLPIEVNRFGLKATELAIARAAAGLGLAGPMTLRMTEASLLLQTAAILSSMHLLAAFPIQERCRMLSMPFPASSSTVCFSGWRQRRSSPAADGIQNRPAPKNKEFYRP